MIILITSACELLLAKVLFDIKISSLFMWSSIYIVKYFSQLFCILKTKRVEERV